MKHKNRYFFVILTLLSAIGLMLFVHREYTGETWGYWMFARIFAETGKFIIPDRSPIYTLYLNLFRWMPYPWPLISEYIVTSIIVCTSLIIFLSPYLGLFLSTYATVLWLPFMQIAEPPVQKLALACSLMAFVVRRKISSRSRIIISYSLLVFAFYFRTTYSFYLWFFVIWDLIQIFREKGFGFIKNFKPVFKTDWPLGLTAILFFVFVGFQSSSPFNTIWFAVSKWFPTDGKSFNIIQAYNIEYADETYGPWTGHDFYFTNKEVFRGATDTIGAIRANPQFIFKQVKTNFIGSIPVLAKMTLLANLIPNPRQFYLDLIIIILMLSGAFFVSKEKLMMPFIFANFLLVGVASLFWIQPRYLFPFIPILILSGWWWGKSLLAISAKLLTRFNLKSLNQINKFISLNAKMMIPGLMITIFSLSTSDYSINLNPISNNFWQYIAMTFAEDLRNNDLKIMQFRKGEYAYSMRSSRDVIEKMIRDCNGFMSLEDTYTAAFSAIPLERIHDIWEIPPFGFLGDPAYAGLNLDNINCILVSRDLEVAIGQGTIMRDRYQNFIVPYVQQLKEMGATAIPIDNYGMLYKLRK
jgi:hypothetical protein